MCSWKGSRKRGVLRDFIKLITRFVLSPVQINSRSDKCIGIQIHPHFKRSLWNIIKLGLALLVKLTGQSSSFISTVLI